MLEVHVVSHTHWDREWYLTREQFRLRLVGLIDRLLDLMESRRDFEYFHLDGQTIVLEDYLELRPQQEPRLRKLIAEGRILIGPWYDMPDEFLVSGESLVRNLALGHRLSRRFGTPMPVGYLPDLFGHVGQMPQILRHFGLDNAILWRGFGGPKAEYWWEAPDGSRVLMLHLPPEGYCNATRLQFKPEAMVERATNAVRFEEGRTAVGRVLLMNGVDHVEPHPVIPEMTRRLAKSLGASVHHSTLPAYVDAVRSAVDHAAHHAGLGVVKGELRSGEEYANLLPGVLSARVYIKQANARVQTLLERWAEPLATFAWMLGAPYPAEELGYAWKTLLQNHPHDSICGCSIDAVHEENMTRFARAEQVAAAVADSAFEAIMSRLEPAPSENEAWRLVAVNTAAQPFTGTLEAIVDLPFESADPRRQVDAEALDVPVRFVPVGARVTGIRTHEGKPVPFQVLGEEFVTTFVMSRYETPWAVRARRLRLAWVAESIPGCGYMTFDVVLDGAEAAGESVEPANLLRQGYGGPPKLYAKAEAGPHNVLATERSAENQFIRISINDDGTVDVVDRRSGARYSRCGELEDVADVGDEYTYSPPASDRRITTADATDVLITRVHAGPVRAAFRVDLVLPLPASASPDRSSRSSDVEPNRVSILVTLDAASPRVGWHVTFDNRARDHRLRLLFPVGAESIAYVRAETAFGVARRPPRREVPAEIRNETPVSYAPTNSFTDAGDDRAGAIVFGEGLMEYEALPPEEHEDARLVLTLLRCIGDLSRDDLVTRSGHAGPGLPTPGAQCLGRHEFRLAFEPRTEPPPAASLFARASSFVAPPRVASVVRAGGTLAPAGSFLHIYIVRGGVVLSACKRADERDTLILRLFNPDDAAATIRLIPNRPVKDAFLVDFLEERTQSLTVRDGAVDVPVGRHRIKTIELSF